MTLGESFAPWVLLLEQESYLSYIKNVIEKMIDDCKLQTHILLNLKNQLQKKLDTIIGENQPASI